MTGTTLKAKIWPDVTDRIAAELETGGAGYQRNAAQRRDALALLQYKWLAGADVLIVKADRLEPLVVLPLQLAVEIAAIAERAKNEIK
jgi:hypothetical protein